MEAFIMQPVDVVDPRIAAGRGDEFRASTQRARADELADIAAADGEDFRLPMNRWYDKNVDLDETECASLELAIPESNVGYRLLQHLGWRGGGLGREQQGITEPIRLDANDTGTCIGLGRRQEERQYTAAEFVERRALEVELQAEEDEERKRKREMEAERQHKIREEVKHELRMFYCKICHKQYQFAHEMEEHLSSYDHHHRKRLAETRAMLSERGKKERERREKRAAEKELARMAAQVKAAQAAAGIKAAPLLPVDEAGGPPPPPEDGDDASPSLPEPPSVGEARAVGGWESTGGDWGAVEAGQDGSWQTRGSEEQAAASWQAAGGSNGSGSWHVEKDRVGGWVAPADKQQQQQQSAKSLFVSAGWQAGTMEKELAAPQPGPAKRQQQQQQQQRQQRQQQRWQQDGGSACAALLPPPPLHSETSYDPFAPDDGPRGGPAAGPAAPPLPPPPLPPSPPAPQQQQQQLPSKTASIALSLGRAASQAKPLGGFALGGKGRSKPAAVAKRASLFGSDSEEEGG